MEVRRWKKYALCLWCMSLLSVLLSYILYQMLFVSIVLFLACIPAFAQMIMLFRKSENMLGTVLNDSPPIYVILALVSFLYTFVNFFVCIALLAKGGPHMENGMYFLQNHGSLVREITKAEYDALRLVEARAVSAFPLLFSALPAVVFSNKHVVEFR